MVLTPANRNFLIAYIVLVGLPLLGLMGVMKAGRALNAPISVNGIWKLSVDTANLSDKTCLQSVAFLQDSALAISQSGKWAVLTLDPGARVTGSGLIQGNSFSAQLPLPEASAKPSACGSDSALTLRASIDFAAKPRTMLGTISMTGCASCTPLSYHAVQQTNPAGKGTR